MTFSTCTECGNDAPAEGCSLCLDCLEAGEPTTRTPSATPVHETPRETIRRLTAERDRAIFERNGAWRDLEATGGVLALRTAALGRVTRRAQREREALARVRELAYREDSHAVMLGDLRAALGEAPERPEVPE